MHTPGKTHISTLKAEPCTRLQWEMFYILTHACTAGGLAGFIVQTLEQPVLLVMQCLPIPTLTEVVHSNICVVKD